MFFFFQRSICETVPRKLIRPRVNADESQFIRRVEHAVERGITPEVRQSIQYFLERGRHE